MTQDNLNMKPDGTQVSKQPNQELLTLDNQTFHAVFNKIQQMATFRMTLLKLHTLKQKPEPESMF